MNDKEIELEIIRLNKEEKLDKSTIGAEFFLEQPQYKKLKESFEASKHKKNSWNWHQFVRVTLEPASIRQYMYDRLLNLLLKHRRTHEDYFELNTVEGRYQLPNDLADLNRLELLFNEYFQLYHKIKNQIHFDYPKTDRVGSSIRGKIDWNKTLRNSSTKFPMLFNTTIQRKDFETPENLLLLLSAHWLYIEAKKLLQIKFIDPLTEDQISLLMHIMDKTKIILKNFPFQVVLNSSKKYWRLNIDDPRIKNLQKKTARRLEQRLVRNQNYSRLLEWIEKFKDLNLSAIDEKTPTRHILESIENLDTVYEAWIFLEFVEYLYEKGILLNFQLGKTPHCVFNVNGIEVTFWYEKSFYRSTKEDIAWAVTSEPDFTATIDEYVLAIFDAKNYSQKQYLTDTKNKMLAYMLNLGADFGSLIYPIFPEVWDEMNPDQKYSKIRSILKKDSSISDDELKKEAKLMRVKSSEELPEKYRKYVQGTELFTKNNFRNENFKGSYTLGMLRMPPRQDNESAKMKNETLDFIFKSIVARIPIAAK